jgi:hypothetical protein
LSRHAAPIWSIALHAQMLSAFKAAVKHGFNTQNGGEHMPERLSRRGHTVDTKDNDMKPLHSWCVCVCVCLCLCLCVCVSLCLCVGACQCAAAAAAACASVCVVGCGLPPIRHQPVGHLPK